MIIRESYLKTLRSVKDINLIKVVTGVRRSGKSTLLGLFRDELEKEKNTKVITYNLEEKENEQFLNDADTFYNQIMSEINPKIMNYIFIDEVQMVPEFERMLDSLYVKPYTDIYVTGSNAYMLSSDIATILTGRYIEVKMQPLSFGEFVKFFPDGSNIYLLFEQYMRYGGFPEAANMLVQGAEEEIPHYLEAVYDTIMEKDIKKRKNIRNMDDFRRVYLYCLDNIGSITSSNRIANVLNDSYGNVDRKTVGEYLQALVDCFLLYPAERYDIRGKEILRTGEKYYSVDLGLTDTLLGRPSRANIGHRLENVVFLELNRRYGNVKIGKNYDKEIDFVAKNHDGEIEYYQVSQTVASDEIFERELSALRNTGDYYRKTILTMDPLETSDSGIVRKNIVNWLLEE